MTTPTSESELAIPFPSVQEPSDTTGGPSLENSVSGSQGSSSLTSSDKLTALPPPVSPPRTTRTRNDSPATAARFAGTPMTRPSHFGLTAAQRGYRRSLDGSTSLPTFSVAESEPWLRSPSHATAMRNSASEHSSVGTPRQRIPSELDLEELHGHRLHHYGPNIVQAAISRLSYSRGGSEPSSIDSPAKRPSPLHRQPESEPIPTKDLSAPTPRSRAVSPLRMFQQWSSGHHHRGQHRHEEPFVPINPFKRKGGRRFRGSGNKTASTASSGPSTLENGSSLDSVPYGCNDALDGPVMTMRTFFQELSTMFTDSIPRQLYLNFLLRLPAMYFTRVSRIFEDAEVSRPEIERMIDIWCRQPGEDRERGEEGLGARYHQGYNLPTRTASVSYPPGLSPPRYDNESSVPRQGPAPPAQIPLPFPDEWTPTSVSPALFRFKLSWEAFIDSLLREWKTFNIISALLSSAIISMFQVPEAVDDPVTRTAALISLMCALMSLTYGCMYIVRFGTMRSMASASNWADDAQMTKTMIWWNVWVLLAMPAIWMAWAMLFFITAILCFVWRTGSSSDPAPGSRPPLPFHSALGPRIAVTSVFLLGMVYLFLIITTLKRYGASRGTATEALLRYGSPTNDPVVSGNNRRPIGEVRSNLVAGAGDPSLSAKESGDNSPQLGKGGSRHETERRGRERYRSPLGRRDFEERRGDMSKDSALGLVDMALKPLTKIHTHDSV